MSMDRFWMVISDASVAKIFKAQKIGGTMNFIAKIENDSAHLHDSDIAADKYGDRQSSNLGGGKSYEQKSDPKKAEIKIFAKNLVNFIRDNIHEFERLVLTAPPKFMHDLREHLTRDLQDKIELEIVKDYSKMATEEIEKDLEKGRP